MRVIWNSFKIAFAMYSKIPMPRCDWSADNRKYSMAFFPWVGLVVGAVFYGWFRLNVFLEMQGYVLSDPFYRVGLMLIPFVVTGGIHLDGLLDTADALSSWQERERRLEILSDSHAGAFAIIVCVAYFFAQYGTYSMITKESVMMVAGSFVLSRTLSALAIVVFPKAKGTGLAAAFSSAAQKKQVSVVLVGYLVALIAAYLVLWNVQGAICLLAAGMIFLYYYRMSMKNFGGITGDLAGYFLQLCELGMAAAAVLACLV